MSLCKNNSLQQCTQELHSVSLDSTLVRGQHRTSQQVTTGVGSVLNKHLYLCVGYFHSTSCPTPVGGEGKEKEEEVRGGKTSVSEVSEVKQEVLVHP